MSHVNRSVKSGSHDSCGVTADVTKKIGSVVHAATDCACEAAHDVRDNASRVVEAVEEKFEQASHATRKSLAHGRDRVERWENDFERAVRARPIASLLIAAGLGAAVAAAGVLLHRSRHCDSTREDQ